MSPVSHLEPRRSEAGAQRLSLGVMEFAAIVDGESLGGASGEDAVPKAMRRRMTAYDMGVARCVAGLCMAGQDEEIVFASRYGNMGVTLDLLIQLVQGELLSPTKFSVSVHNAAAGAASQIAQNRAGHTAVAAGVRSLTAGLTEAWSRIATGSPSVIFVYSDFPLMVPYDPFDEPGGRVQLAARLAASEGAGGHDVSPGRVGAGALTQALAGGARGVSWEL